MGDGGPRSWLRAYRLMDYSLREYIIRLVLPFTVLGIVTLFLSFLISDILGSLQYLMFFLTVLFITVGVFYPKIWAESRRKEIEQNLHLFITHLGILATAEVSRVDMFRILSEKKKEYGPLAEEASKIVILLDTWNQSLDEACRIVSRRTVSPILSDFFERMAHSLESGEDIRDFILGEQDVVISDYEAMYEGSLDMLYHYRDLFTSITLAVVFFIVFGILTPSITGLSPLLLIAGAIAVFIASEVGFLLATEFTMPVDPIWNETDIITLREERIGKVEIIAILLFVGFAVFAALQLIFRIPFSTNPPIPIEIYIALPLTPLAIPGFMIWREEGKTKNRDKNFPSFLRTLGASASARETTSANVLEKLRKKDFAMLTEPIRNLYKRLRTRINRKLAWDYFSAETGSFLIRRFSDMYFEGTSRGGDPGKVSKIISNNFNTIMRVREKRFTAARNLTGTLYGITAGAVASIFVGFYLATEMIDVIGSVVTEPFGSIFFPEVYDALGIRFMLLMMVLTNALLCSLYVRSASSSHEVSSHAHMVILLWIGVIIACLMEAGMGFFLSV